MVYDNIINELFIQFPDLKNDYEKEGEYIEGLAHLCYSIVFVPFIRQVCYADDEEGIKSACNFMELMAESDNEDERVSEVLVVSVLEAIISERELINQLKHYLGEKTLQLLSTMEKDYGW